MVAMRSARIAVIGLAVAGLLASPAAAGRTVSVSIEDLEYSRTTVRIKAGDRVRWTWNDGTTPHDVTSRGRPRFRSSQTKESGTHTVTFERPGTYRYVCTIHLNMRGRVVVR